jgi:hypothetical protein
MRFIDDDHVPGAARGQSKVAILLESVNGGDKRTVFRPESFGICAELRLIARRAHQGKLRLELFRPLIN